MNRSFGGNSGSGSGSGVGRPFKSPMPSTPVKTLSPEDQKKINEEREKEIDLQIKALVDEGIEEGEHKAIIDHLHSFNDYKDLAQMLMGQIAVQEKIPIKTVATNLGAPTEEEK